MRPQLTVIQVTSSFEQIWPELAESAGCDLRTVDVQDAAAILTASFVVLSAGGAEHAVETRLAALRDGNGSRRPPIAVVGSVGDHRLAILLLQNGADNYFALPGELGALRTWIVEHGERVRAAAEHASIIEQQRSRYDYTQLIGESAGLRKALEMTTRITPHREATVLITGETGTGKELIARAIHYNGAGADRPFVEINCSALPTNLLESELFGYEPGAFTDARIAKPGLFELAESGTLFLDEIGELPLELQAKLLRVLEEKRVRRLGATASREIDVRIIAATHVDLAAAVKAQRFREDLFYRLNVFRIHLPPLRERRDDIEPLARHFHAHFAARYKLADATLSPRLLDALCAHSWPGNIRELRNVVERATLMGHDDLFLDGDATASSPSAAAAAVLPFPSDLATIERAAAAAMVAHHGGNKSAAASALGISRKRLYALLAGESA